MLKILVTGGAGYIGSQTALHLLDEGYEVVILDNMMNGHEDVIPNEALFENQDLCDIDGLEQVFDKHDISAVIHFAAGPSIVSEKAEALPSYYENNLKGTLNLFEVMRKKNVKNIVFSSTAAVYGIPDSTPITEEMDKNPINVYGYVKYMTEKILADYNRSGLINYVALRYFNACGADSDGRTGELHNPETHLIPLVLQTALKKRDKIYIFGDDYDTEDGTCIRDYVHTEDLARAHVYALKKLFEGKLTAEAINLGSGEGYSVRSIINEAKKITKVDFAVEVTERREGDPDVLIASSAKAKELLDWQPEHDLESIIKTAWNWHKSLE